MSVMRKKPYIEEKLALLTKGELGSLKTALNTNSSDTFYSLVNKSHYLPSSTESTIIKAVKLETDKDKQPYNGILIFSSNMCLLIGYHRFQDLMLLELDPVNKKYKRINEYCDIDELRRIIDDKLIEAGAVEGYVTEEELPGKVDTEIDNSLLSGSLKTVLQNKTLSVSDFPFTSDIDNQHDVVNEGLLPNGDMSDLTESDISKLTLTLNRIINKGWLKTGTSSCIRISSVIYNEDMISVNVTQILFGNATVKSGSSYRIFLDIANTLYEFEQGSYN